MTEIKHTPEPWYCGIDPIDEPAEPSKGIDWVIYTKDDNGWENGILAPMWGDNREADAKRIVACVNACAGIPTEKLEANTMVEAGALQELLKQGHKRLAAAVKAAEGIPTEALEAGVVAEGIAALRKMSFVFDRDEPHKDWEQAIIPCRFALAKLTTEGDAHAAA